MLSVTTQTFGDCAPYLLPEAQMDANSAATTAPGLGTKFGEKIRGGMFGSGIDTAITSAYEWLMDNYEPDDEIFIFGFSRGAYTARSLSCWRRQI
jgi:hypothetical protein